MAWHMSSITNRQSIFNVMGDPTRRRILGLLVAEGELCVCELTAALNEIQPKVSRHLSVIRESGLVGARREGTWIFYSLAEPLPRWMVDMLEAMRDGAVPELVADRARLKSMSGRPTRAGSRSVHGATGHA